MNETPFTPGICRENRNFRFLSGEALTGLGNELGLCLPQELLARYQEVCRTVLLRDPTETELKFLDRVFCLFRQMPEGVLVAAVTGADDETARVWGDICRKGREIGIKTPPTETELLALCGKALARAGITAASPLLTVGSAAGIAAACRGKQPELLLNVGNCAGALLPPQGKAAPGACMLYLMTATDETAFPAEIAAFLAANTALNLQPLALTGGEGILPHLATGTGLDVDFSLLPGYDPEHPEEVLFAAGRRAFLFFAPQSAVPLLAGRENLLLFGSANRSGRLVLRAGNAPLCVLPSSFFPLLATCAPMALPVKPTESAAGEVALAESDAALLAGVSCGSDVPYAIARCLAALAAGGAALSTVRMSAVLEQPAGDACATATAEALPLIFGYHRAAAELVLPTAGHAAIEDERLPHPRLTVFLLANRKNGGAAPLPVSAAERVRNGDFEEMRRALSGKM